MLRCQEAPAEPLAALRNKMSRPPVKPRPFSSNDGDEEETTNHRTKAWKRRRLDSGPRPRTSGKRMNRFVLRNGFMLTCSRASEFHSRLPSPRGPTSASQQILCSNMCPIRGGRVGGQQGLSGAIRNLLRTSSLGWEINTQRGLFIRHRLLLQRFRKKIPARRREGAFWERRCESR